MSNTETTSSPPPAEAAGGCQYQCVGTPSVHRPEERAQHDRFVELFDQVDFAAINLVLDDIIASTAGDTEYAGVPSAFDLADFVADHNWAAPTQALRFAKGITDIFERGRSWGQRNPQVGAA